MSSQILPAPAGSDLVAAALTDVAERSLFAFVDVLPEDEFAARCGMEAAWLCAEVAYRGPRDGVMRCALPREVALECFAAFLGEPGDEAGDGPLFDMMGELANMICGAWLTRARPTEVYDLNRPQVAAMPPGWGPPAVAAPPTVPAALNDRPVAVWVAGH
ncbi:MAG: chemotaxis protein CheX [Vicinamibacteria bacterium]